MALFRHLPIAALQVDVENYILDINSRASALFGDTEQVVGSKLSDFIAEQNRTDYFTFFQDLTANPDLSLTTTLHLPGDQINVQVTIRGSVTEPGNRIFIIERCDPYGPGCGEKCQYTSILEAQFQNNPGGILLVNKKMKMISFNREFIKIWDIPQEVQDSRDEQANVSKILEKVVDPDGFMATIKALYNRPNEMITDEVFLKDGRVLYRHSYPIYNNKSYLGRVWHFLDITQLKKANYQIESQQIFQNAILDHIQDGVIACDAKGQINLFNRTSQEFFGFTSSEEIPDSYTDLEMFSQDGLALPLESSPLSIALDGKSVKNYQFNTITKEGVKHSLRVSGQPMYDREKNKLGAVVSLHNITDLKKAKEQLRFLAYHDSLTNLPNRRLFHDLLRQNLKHAHRNNLQVGVLFLDLDNFKRINDIHGHAVGDQILVEVASCLHQRLRESDIICRWGGDEFVIGLLDSSGRSGIVNVAEKLCKSVMNYVHRSDQSKQISISIGIAIFPDHGSLPDRLIRNADVAMYRAKRRGKNRCEVFELT